MDARAAYLSSALAASSAMMVLWPLAFGLPVWTGRPPIACALAQGVAAGYLGRFHFRRRLWGWLGPDA